MAKVKKEKLEQFEVNKDIISDLPIEVGEIQKLELTEQDEKTEILLAVKQPDFVSTKHYDTSLSFEQRINAFLSHSASNDFIKLNDFLKSLYGVPTSNAINKWLIPGEMKSLGFLLKQMQDKGEITIKNDAHLKLGKHFYAGEDKRQFHYNLENLVIEGKK